MLVPPATLQIQRALDGLISRAPFTHEQRKAFGRKAEPVGVSQSSTSLARLLEGDQGQSKGWVFVYIC